MLARRSATLMASLSLAALTIAASYLAPAIAQPERNTPGAPSSQPQPARPEPLRPEGVRPAPGQPRDRLPGPPGERGPGRGPGGPGGSGGEFRNIDQAMKTLDRGLETLTKSIDSGADRDRVLASLSQMERAAIFAKDQKPHHLPEGADPKQAEIEFRTMGVDLLIEIAKIEKMVLAGDTAGAKAGLKNLESLRDAGHDKFMEEEEEGKDEKDAAPRRDGGR